MVIEKAMHYCRSILQNVSRSFSLTIPLVEKNILAPILVGYLEARIMDNFEDENPGKSIDSRKRIEYIKKVMSIIEKPESPAAKKNMEDIAQVASDFISNPHYLDLAKNMDKVMMVHRTMDTHAQATISLWYGRMAKGMQKYLNTRIDTFQQLDEYCYYVAGTIGGMLTDLVIQNSAETSKRKVSILRKNQIDFGLFLQKVNIIRDFREDILKNEKIFWPYKLFEDWLIVPSQTIERVHEKKAMPILGEMIGNARSHIPPVQKYISSLPEDLPGFKNFSIINMLLGVETLKKMENNPDVFYSDSPVKIDKVVSKEIISNPLESFHSL